MCAYVHIAYVHISYVHASYVHIAYVHVSYVHIAYVHVSYVCNAERVGDDVNLRGVSCKMMLELSVGYSNVTVRIMIIKSAKGDTPTRDTLFSGRTRCYEYEYVCLSYTYRTVQGSCARDKGGVRKARLISFKGSKGMIGMLQGVERCDWYASRGRKAQSV